MSGQFVVDLNLMPYRDAWDLQKKLHARVCADPNLAYLLKVEHPPVLTLGRHAQREHLLMSPAQYRDEKIDLIEIDRGGEVTVHSPGQMVIYPILSVSKFGLTPKRYIGLLEATVIELLQHYGIEGRVHPQYPGVWVKDDKVCAMGVRIHNRVTMHGLAFNVLNDLSLFGKIIPCGITGKGVTSLSRLGVDVGVGEVFKKFLGCWQNHFGEVNFLNDIHSLLRA